MKNLILKNIQELSDMMMNDLVDKKGSCSVLFIDDAIELTRCLLENKDIVIGVIEMEQPEYAGYEKEYYVSLSDDGVLCVEHAWHNDNKYNPAGYLSTYCDVLYIDGDASAKLLSCIEYATGFELSQDDGCECESCECESKDTKDDKIEKNYNYLGNTIHLKYDPETNSFVDFTVTLKKPNVKHNINSHKFSDLIDLISPFFEIHED